MRRSVCEHRAEQKETRSYPGTRRMVFRSLFGLLRNKDYSLSMASRSEQMINAPMARLVQGDCTAQSSYQSTCCGLEGHTLRRRWSMLAGGLSELKCCGEGEADSLGPSSRNELNADTIVRPLTIYEAVRYIVT